MMDVCNQTFASLVNRNEEYYPGQNLPFLSNAKVDFVPNIIFIQDEYGWNNRNDYNSLGVPYLSDWYLGYKDAEIYNDATTPKAINLYFTSDGQAHQQMIVLGTTTDYEGNVYLKHHSASEIPALSPDCGNSSNFGNFHSMRCHIPNVWLKLWWFRNVLGNPDSQLENEVGRSIAHELGHLMGLCHTPPAHLHALMRTQFGGNKDYMTTTEISKVHRAFAIYPSLWQFVDCDKTYVSAAANRIVTTNETWDLKMRLYTNVIVKTGATLNITCEILMPLEGTITVERGAKLVIDGGTVRRANTCSPSQFWRGIAAQGNPALPQPDPNGVLSANQAGVVILKNQGSIEGAVVGAAAKFPAVFEFPEFRGAVIDAANFTFKDCRKGAEFMKYDFPNRSQFNNVVFERTSTGSMYAGVTIWDTDGILFEGCQFINMTQNGIRAGDAVFNVKKKNRFSGSEIAILAGASAPLSGQIQVGVLGAQNDDRNRFFDNTVGIRATSNSKVEIFSNDFENFDFDIAINGTTQSAVTDNTFTGSAAGNQFDNTGINSNQTLCNTYSGNTVGANIVGKNTGFLFRQEDFSTLEHDLFIEGLSSNAGEIQMFQGLPGSAHWNYFSAGKPENIKTSTVSPYNYTIPFWYFHPDPVINSRLKPKCPLNETCVPQSNFYNWLTGGGAFSDCMFSAPAENPPCVTRPCLEAIRLEISQKTTQYAQNPTDALKAELQVLITQREFVTDELIREYVSDSHWDSVETLLNEDLNLANRRRVVGAKLEQKQFSAASALLQSFPQNTTDDQYFVQVQTINAARLSDPQFTLSGPQQATLLAVAEAPSPEAGYAQTLLGILTGQVFTPKLPDLGGERSAGLSKTVVSSGLEISPNPVNDLLQVRIQPATVQQTLELRALTTGNLVHSVDVSGEESFTLPVRHLPSGIYLLVLREQGAVVGHQKVVVQH